MRWVFLPLLPLLATLFVPVGLINASNKIDPALIPPYILRGLEDYRDQGYATAVRTWLADSPHEAATTVASNQVMFKNIEMLAGKYRSYDVLLTQETPSSNLVYVRMNYERFPGYILFTSQKRQNKWVLAKINLDRKQRYGQLQ
jgi:hypothetical protein